MKMIRLIVDAELAARMLGLQPGDRIVGATMLKEGELSLIIAGDTLPEVVATVTTTLPHATVPQAIRHPDEARFILEKAGASFSAAVQGWQASYGYEGAPTWPVAALSLAD